MTDTTDASYWSITRGLDLGSGGHRHIMLVGYQGRRLQPRTAMAKYASTDWATRSPVLPQIESRMPSVLSSNALI